MLMRPANKADFSALFEVMSGTAWNKAEYLKTQLDRASIVVAEDAGIIHGLIVWNYEFFSLPFIWLVAVSAKYRGQGIAGQLFAFVERECVGGQLYTSTNESHEMMRRFLERRGYKRAGTVDVDPGDAEVFYRIDLA